MSKFLNQTNKNFKTTNMKTQLIVILFNHKKQRNLASIML